MQLHFMKLLCQITIDNSFSQVKFFQTRYHKEFFFVAAGVKLLRIPHNRVVLHIWLVNKSEKKEKKVKLVTGCKIHFVLSTQYQKYIYYSFFLLFLLQRDLITESSFTPSKTHRMLMRPRLFTRMYPLRGHKPTPPERLNNIIFFLHPQRQIEW